MMKNKIRFPDFLGIGAGRSGSTWLYHNLIIQSDMWLPPNKELHYFDRNIKYPSPSFLHESSFWKRLVGQETYNKQFRQIMARKLVKNIIQINYFNLKWSLKYYTGNISDHWYSSLFTVESNKIVGEITPAYQMLDENDVEKIHRLMPNTKVIFLVRNPIDRTWSQLRKNNQHKLPLNEIRDIVRSPNILLRNDYLRTIKLWSKYYGEDKFKVIYFDDILNNPSQLINNILNYIKNTKNKELVYANNNKINAAPVANMPDVIQDMLEDELEPLMRSIANELGSYSNLWLKSLERERRRKYNTML